jgi:hypothetical protein
MTALIVFCLLGTAARGAGEDHDAAQIVSVEIEHCGPAWDYGLRVLDREGRISCVTVGAKSGQI